MVNKLEPNQIFVFGSNMAGQHLGGAALQALQWGAVMGQGEGLQGQCYAFPTLDENFEKRGYRELYLSRIKFEQCAIEHPDKEFLLTKVGTGIAGYAEEFMDLLLIDLPTNVKRV
jgi:hypothetical protein